MLRGVNGLVAGGAYSTTAWKVRIGYRYAYGVKNKTESLGFR